MNLDCHLGPLSDHVVDPAIQSVEIVPETVRTAHGKQPHLCSPPPHHLQRTIRTFIPPQNAPLFRRLRGRHSQPTLSRRPGRRHALGMGARHERRDGTLAAGLLWQGRSFQERTQLVGEADQREKTG